jgi:hypothetical protein
MLFAARFAGDEQQIPPWRFAVRRNDKKSWPTFVGFARDAGTLHEWE